VAGVSHTTCLWHAGTLVAKGDAVHISLTPSHVLLMVLYGFPVPVFFPNSSLERGVATMFRLRRWSTFGLAIVVLLSVSQLSQGAAPAPKTAPAAAPKAATPPAAAPAPKTATPAPAPAAAPKAAAPAETPKAAAPPSAPAKTEAKTPATPATSKTEVAAADTKTEAPPAAGDAPKEETERRAQARGSFGA